MIPTCDLAERSVLSVMMQDQTCMMRGLTELDINDFFNSKNRELFITMQRLSKEGKEINMPAIAAVYADVDHVIAIGTELSFTSEIDSYIATLRETWQRRELITACNKIAHAAEENADGYLELAQRSVADITAMGGNTVEPIGDEAVEITMSFEAAQIGHKTGFVDYDAQIGGLQKGKLIVVAGRPGMGKSSFAMNIAMNVAQEKTVAIFTLEMPKAEVVRRAASSMSFCSKRDILVGEPSRIEKYIQAGVAISKMKLFIDDRATVTADNILAACYRIKQKYGLDLVVIDYLQLMRVKARKNSNREQEVAEITRSMKLLAREMDCTVILISQLSRKVDERNDHRPMLSDLRESGAIEQDADVVTFMYRPAEYDHDADAREAYAITEKNRDGVTATVRLCWDGKWFKFSSYYGGNEPNSKSRDNGENDVQGSHELVPAK